MLPSLDVEKVKKEILDSQIWRSMFRGGVWKDTPRDRASHIIGNVWLHLHPVRARPRALEWTYTWGLGGISFVLFLILTVTGVLLMFYYRPTIDLAYRDMKDLEFAITLGKLFRNMHRWAAQAMVVAVIAHMVRVFLTGSYKKPREFNWGVGVLLLTLTLFLSFTGYLLPWDQLAIWAVTVGTNMAAASPGLGNEGPFGSLMGMRINNDIRFVLLGGTMVGENTLLRFYVMHCVAVPLLVGILLIVHFWRVRKDSFSAAPYNSAEEKLEVWPHLVKREYIAAAGCLLFIMLWSILMDAPLEVQANPNVTPNPSKAPWYFVGLQELLVYFDPWIAGVILPNLIIVGLMALPYIDTNPKGVGYYTWKERPFANAQFMLGVVLWFVLIYIGYYCRGPNFFWYWPWESWLDPKPAPPPTWSVFGPVIPNCAWPGQPAAAGQPPCDSLFPIWMGLPLVGLAFAASMALPKMIKAEIESKKAHIAFFAVMILAVAAGKLLGKMTLLQGGWLLFFGYLHFYFGFLLPQRHIRNLDWARYLVTMFLVICTTGVLLKMCARLAFDIKYLITIPQISMNI
ncbi:MAG: cytochrome b N-terminal domain-containing protein [Elusimicrobia bacterium]|nr:cytochrome b N-terminal domain-containing protein [Elusimicrobiota bacterium]